MSPMEAFAGHQTIKVVAPLFIPSGAKCYGTNGACFRGVVVLLVRLGILTKCDPTVFGVVNVKASDDGTRAQGLQGSELGRKSVQPKYAEETISMIMRGG